MFQLSSSLNGTHFSLPSAHPLEDCGVKMKINRQWVYIFPCSEVALSLPNRFSVSNAPSKETGPFGVPWMLQMWREDGAGVGAVCSQLREIWLDPGEEGGQTRDNLRLLDMAPSSSPTSPTTKASCGHPRSCFSPQKHNLASRKQGSNVVYQILPCPIRDVDAYFSSKGGITLPASRGEPHF